ncbi:MAG: BrnA antitoxin family protein [Amaricoccus sp.]
MAQRKLTKAEERANAELHDILYELEKVRFDMKIQFERMKFEHIPAEWNIVEDKVKCRRKKVRIHAAYDEDVAKFFKAMGHGYQARMNLVLRTYMLGILSRHLQTRKNEDWMGNEI